jgi:hypothetical protein
MNQSDPNSIEQRLSAIRLKVSARLDERVERLAKGMDVAGAHDATEDVVVPKPLVDGRLRRRWILRAAVGVAAVFAVALAIWALLNGRSNLMPSAYAQVTEALANSKASNWIRMQVTVAGGKGEGWLSHDPFRVLNKQVNGDLEVLDWGKHRQYEYNAAKRTITVREIIEGPPKELSGNQSFLEMMESQFKKMQAEGKLEVKREERTVGGKTYTVLKINLPAPTQGFQCMELMVDTAKKRIVQAEYLEKENGKSVATAHFEYPAEGPTDIYALGAPKDAILLNEPSSLDSHTADADRAFDDAISEIDRRANWPATPEEVVKEYWEARAAKRFDEMAILWPGSAIWNASLLKNEKPVEYVFGKAEKMADGKHVIVPYAARQDFERTGKYPLKMLLMNERSTTGRYYIVSGN